MNLRVLIAAVWGTLIGCLTFAAGPLAVLSPHVAIAVVQTVLTYAMLPGLIVAAEVGSLAPAAIINTLIYFGISFFALGLLPTFRRKALV